MTTSALPPVSNALSAAEQALLSGDEDKLYDALKAVGVQSLQVQNKGWYLKQLQADREAKDQVGISVQKRQVRVVPSPGRGVTSSSPPARRLQEKL